MNNKFIFWLFAIVFCVIIPASAQDQVLLDKGDFAPNFTEVDEQGNTISLDDYRGKVVLLNFTATWCGPCWEAYTPMNELQEQYKDDLVIISFHMDNMKKKWKEKAKSKGIIFDVISIWESDTKKEIFKSFAPELYPSFVIINKEGKIKKKWSGYLEFTLRKRVHKTMRKHR
jgi:peroxiredoxin